MVSVLRLLPDSCSRRFIGFAENVVGWVLLCFVFSFVVKPSFAKIVSKPERGRGQATIDGVPIWLACCAKPMPSVKGCTRYIRWA